MRANPDVVGTVIAGGRSLRFGGEKAAALLAGESLLSWAVRRLQRSCAAVAVNARPGTAAAALATDAGLSVLHDVAGDPLGPLAGVRVALEWAEARGAKLLAVSPCDSPLLPESLFDELIAAARAANGAAMAVTDEGRQPLCAVWPVNALARVREAIAAGAHPPTWRVLESVGAVPVNVGPAEAFANVNTREDLAALAARFTSDTDRR